MISFADTNPSFELPVGFAGGIAESATGLVRFGWRDYEPRTGRWTARDPILFKGGQANLFLYTGNDSLNFVDRAGLWSLAFNAGFHVPPLPGYASAGLNIGSEKVHPFGGDRHWEGKGITPEAVVGSMADIGVSAGISDFSNTGGKCAGDTINLGLGRYAGVQITLRKDFTWSDPTTWVDGVTVGLGLGASLPVSYTIPLDQ